MNWKKILSVMIVSVLVIGGLSVLGTSARGQDDEGELIDSIDFTVTLDMESGAATVYDGDADLFMHSVDGLVYQGLPEEWRLGLDTWTVLGSYNNWFINPAHEGHETPQMGEAVDEGWIDSPEEVQWLANDADGDWTVNPFAHGDIRFAMQYLNREEMVEDLMGGFGVPRFGPTSATLEVWAEWFEEPIEEDYDLDGEGDMARVEWIIEQAMLEIQDEVAFGEVSGGMDGWYYEAPDGDEHQIEIKIMGRIEDWREDKASWMASILADMGFDTSVDPVDSATAIPRAFYGVYDNLEYHMYTGGWISTTASYFQTTATNQMYAPWYGFMHTWATGHWNYNEEGMDDPIGPSQRVTDEYGLPDLTDQTVADMNELGMELDMGQVVTEENYWEGTADLMQMGFAESIRVFMVDDQSFYPYNPDQLLAAVPEAINGYDTYFGPRTMRTDDGTLDAILLTGEDRPYMDNWNVEEGSSDVYGEYQRRVARDYPTWVHPQTGRGIQVNMYWGETYYDEARTDPFDRQEDGVSSDFEWDGEELIGNLDVPDEAVDYVPGYVEDLELEWDDEDEMWTSTDVVAEVQEWKSVEWLQTTEEAELTDDPEILGDPDATEDELIVYEPLIEDQAATSSRLEINQFHTWHDGQEFCIRDVFAWYGRMRELGSPYTEPVSSGRVDSSGPWFANVQAMEWDAEEQAVTVYGMYPFPDDDAIGGYYAGSLAAESEFWPETHPLTYYAWDHMHSDTEYAAEEGYNYESGEQEFWIHQLSEEHSNVMVDTLDEMIDAGYIPEPLDEGRMPDHIQEFAMDMDEFEASRDSISAFVDDTSHSYLGFGPFRIDDYDPVGHDMSISRWEDYGFPFDGETAYDVLERAGIPEDEWDDHVKDGMGDYVYENGYWSEQFEIEEIRFDILEIPVSVERGEDIEVSADGHYAFLFPETRREALGEHMEDYRFTVRDEMGGDILVEVGADEIDLTDFDDFSEFSGLIPTDDVDPGEYWVTVEALPLGEDDWSFAVTIADTVAVTAPDLNLEAVDFTIDPEVAGVGEDVTISGTVENIGDADDTAVFYAEDEAGEREMIHEVDVAEGQEEEVEFTYSSDHYGTYMIRMFDGEDQFVSDIGEVTFEGSDVQVGSLTVDPQFGGVPLDVTITVGAQNLGNIDGEVDVEVDGEVIETLTFEPSDTIIFETFEYTFEEIGEYEITVGEHVESVEVVERVYFEGVSLDVPEEVMVGDTETITAEVDSHEEDTTAYIYVDDEMVHEEAITEMGEHEFSTDYTFDVAGEIDVEVRDEEDRTVMSETVNVLESYELTINVEGEGTTDPEPGTHTYAEGEDVEVEAIPDEGHMFVEWTGDHESEEDTITVTMDSDMEITAHFEEEPDPAEFAWIDDLAVDGETDELEIEEGDEVEITAEIENVGDETGEVVLEVNGVEWEYTVEGGETLDIEETHEFEDEGEYDVTLLDQSVTVIVEEEEDVPGFTLALLVLGAVVAVAIYYKKEQ